MFCKLFLLILFGFLECLIFLDYRDWAVDQVRNAGMRSLSPLVLQHPGASAFLFPAACFQYTSQESVSFMRAGLALCLVPPYRAVRMPARCFTGPAALLLLLGSLLFFYRVPRLTACLSLLCAPSGAAGSQQDQSPLVCVQPAASHSACLTGQIQ